MTKVAKTFRISGSPWRWCRAQLRRGLDLVFPPTCSLCDGDLPAFSPGAAICESCEARLCLDAGPACRRCGMPAASPEARDCADCRRRRWRFAATYRLGLYEGELREAVLRAKTLVGERLAMSLGRLLGRHAARQFAADGYDLVAPVPAHWQRRVMHRSHAAAAMAHALGGELGIPVAADLLACRRNIKRQSSLPLSERRRNVRGAFRLTWGYDIRDARILLADDVMTSGATAHELAGVLRRGGASCVAVAVVARATGPDW